jgi:hypothetical protein
MSKSKSTNVTWSTEEEFRIIRSLGTNHGIGKKNSETPYHELVARYIKAAEKRHYWSPLNKEAILKYAQNVLDNKLERIPYNYE